ncbi:formylglycine-generating enzyme family protein [Terasakiella pusilla]|uniref:formylglycine-generating enzyme family protein n=1 Tax=Terasakiella pusilla TaxID=64973 RepID=UPI003AA99400
MHIFIFLSALFASLPLYAADTPPAGSVFKDCESCPEVIALPPGSYVRGDADSYKYERPAQKVTIDYPFALGKYEVTFEEWEACVQDKACKATPDDHGWGKGRYPIINVTFQDIQDYLDWLSQKTGQTYRLPSETEWEYAARAGTTTDYWWGDDVGVNNANCRNCGSKWSGIGSAPVGSFNANPWGFHDMNGNAWDWVADCWTPHYALAPTDGSPRLDGDCKHRVTRGGSWYYFPKLSRSAYRYKNHVDIFSYNISFRVLRELKP